MKTIKELSTIDKPREKLLKNGVKSLQNYELAAIILGSGVKGKDVIKLSKEIIKIFENDFNKLSLEKLLNIFGLGYVKASQILASVELSKRYLIEQNRKINNSGDVSRELDEYKNKRQEYFIAIYLDGANNILTKEVITIGTLNQSLVHPREVFAYAIEKRCASIIIAHNHPSGILTPSYEDIEVTKRLTKASRILGIELLDHIIVTKDNFMSFRDEGLL